MTGRRLMIYGNWSAYDELSDGVPLTEELAMRQFGELLRLRACGVRFDAYLMDAFWFDPAGGYRSWRKPNWPDGPARWLDACRANEIIPGLWFTANTLCHIEPATAWLDSADEDRWGLCCFQGGFLDDYLDVLDYWYLQGIRIFKIDFASFTAAPPSLKSRMSVIEIRHRNIEAFRNGLAQFREQIGVRAEQDVVGIRIAVIGLAGVQIITANLAEKNLALHAKAAVRDGGAAGGDQPRDHLKLRA